MPFKGCLSDACVLMKIERFVLKPLRKIERFVLKQHTFRFADYIRTSTFSISAILYSTGIGGCTLFVAYRLTILKPLPSRLANSV